MPNLTTKAFRLASELHVDQTRKASIVPGVPYLSHLMEVAGMVSANGGDDTTTAAALLHDVLEDVSQDAAYRILTECGPDVLTFVHECTEIGLGTGGQFKAPWRNRKEAYIAHLKFVCPEALLISVADKLQSARELYRQVRVQGDAAYEPFAKKEYATIAERKENVLWFHDALHGAFLNALHAMPDTVRIKPGIQGLAMDFQDVVHDLLTAWMQSKGEPNDSTATCTWPCSKSDR